jgi:hypothetical protein
MTITSFDSDIPMMFIKEDNLQGRLMIFLNHVMCRVLKKDLIKKDRDKISFIVLDKEHIELKYDNNYIGVVKLITMTKDFIFKQ